MNLRKFYVMMTVTIAVFLFAAGIGIIYYINGGFLSSDIPTNSDNPINKLFDPFKLNKQPFNILVLGGDKVNKNSDTMMIANFDPSTNKVNIMSIPRDTKVLIEDNYRKINFAYPHGGIELTVKTVSELMDVKIKYYIFVDTKAFRNIIDLLDGIDINIPADMDYDDPTQNLHIHLKKGLKHLDGEQAEEYVRFRDPNHWTKEIKKYYDGSDLKRIEAQQGFISELVRQKLTLQYLPRLNSIISTLFANIDTNFSMSEIVKLSGYAGKINMSSLNFISMPGKTYDGTPWYYLCDVAETRGIMAENFKCDSSFVYVDSSSKESYINGTAKAGSTKTASSSGTKKASAKSNPSNADSSLKGTQKPEP
jgi:polyisoprenyl-teichoic acid--peptidoglycan teichoic acid transferase